jgi:alkanesulfonate monooxygenase SsuD/methylene tetrahydromethanopterin reductase-like flavin-dependent oxidoreductase (luciferase family)
MMAQALTFGLDVGIYGWLATRDYILELAALAEASGLESLWVADHVIFPVTLTSAYPYSTTGAFPIDMTQEPLLEPLATMGVLVGATQRVKIGTAVLVMPYRHPVLLARMLVTLDVLSGGRTLLGAGVGWLAEEFAALDARPFPARGRVTDECIEIVKADDLRRLVDLGYSRIIVRYRGSDAEEQRQQLRIFIENIIPKVS